jgi:hypothetical protein
MVQHIYLEPGRVYDSWARTLEDFVAHGKGDNLAWKKGDTIEVMNKLENGWWNGSKDGIDRGWFDSSWVAPCTSPLKEELGRVDYFWVRALHDITPIQEGDLACKKGDMIEVSNKREDGMWKGTADGITNGWFLSSSTEDCEQRVLVRTLLATERCSKM